jgi:hypothetical protein
MMRLEGHEIPTVFVRGHASPEAVRDAEARLQWLCAPLHSVRFSVLWVEATPTACTVGVELGVGDQTIAVDGSGATVSVATGACMEHLRSALSDAAVDVSR